MFDELMISGDAVVASASEGGSAVAVRLPWYRSLPLSCVAGVRVTLAGETLPAERVRLRLYGSEHRVEELPGLHDVFWFVLDEAELWLDAEPARLPASFELDLELELRIPYPEYGTRSFPQVARCSKTLGVQGVPA